VLLTEVKDMMNDRLLTTPIEQKEKIEYLKELIQREKANNELIKKLKEEQAVAFAEKEKDVSLDEDFNFFYSVIILINVFK
jgi:hypothetical protein